MASCAKALLVNVAAIGIGIGLYEQKIMPAIIGVAAAVIALLIAWGINDD